jgi:hypothetical protein
MKIREKHIVGVLTVLELIVGSADPRIRRVAGRTLSESQVSLLLFFNFYWVEASYFRFPFLPPLLKNTIYLLKKKKKGFSLASLWLVVYRLLQPAYSLHQLGSWLIVIKKKHPQKRKKKKKRRRRRRRKKDSVRVRDVSCDYH